MYPKPMNQVTGVETVEKLMTSSSTVLADVAQQESLAPHPVDVVPRPAITLDEAKHRIAQLQKFVQEMMVVGEDYGLIPGCKKPSLLKPGAEKLCDIFGFAKHVTILDRVEDWDKGVFAYTVKAILVSKRTGMTEAEGVGSCNSREKRYRQQDPFNIANTLLKMAKKRAMVDAVLSATRASGLFTQDVEEMDVERPQQRTATRNNRIPVGLRNQLYSLVTSSGLSSDDAKDEMAKRYGVSNSRDLTEEQINDFIHYLQSSQPANQ